MKNTWKKIAMAVLAIATLGLAGRNAQAATSATLNIDVSVSANLSVSISTNGVEAGDSSSTQSVTWNGTDGGNARKISPSSVTVYNDSGLFIEGWKLSVSSPSFDQGSAGSWALKTTTTTLPGVNEFAVQAVFGSTMTAKTGCPSSGDAGWNDISTAVPLTTTGVLYTNTTFAGTSAALTNGNAGADSANGNMNINSYRALCWRVITPSMVTNNDTQNIQLTLTASSGL
jgi:hypothetical protein